MWHWLIVFLVHFILCGLSNIAILYSFILGLFSSFPISIAMLMSSHKINQEKESCLYFTVLPSILGRNKSLAVSLLKPSLSFPNPFPLFPFVDTGMCWSTVLSLGFWESKPLSMENRVTSNEIYIFIIFSWFSVLYFIYTSNCIVNKLYYLRVLLIFYYMHITLQYKLDGSPSLKRP